MRGACLGAVATLAAALGVAAPAGANDGGSIARTVGNVTATVQWDPAELGIANARLSIVRDGVPFAPLVADICEVGCIIAPDDATTTPEQSALKVADLDLDGEPEILLDTFSGGAHCCVTTRLLSYDGAAYVAKDIFWGDVSYQLADLNGDGRLELNGFDPRFSAVFTAYAASAFPPQVLQVAAGQVVDVTKRFPAVVKADAAARLKTLRKSKRRDDMRGVLAAYAADQYLLGKGRVALQEIARQRRRHSYRVTNAYRSQLLKRLKTWGYRGSR